MFDFYLIGVSSCLFFHFLSNHCLKEVLTITNHYYALSTSLGSSFIFIYWHRLKDSKKLRLKMFCQSLLGHWNSNDRRHTFSNQGWHSDPPGRACFDFARQCCIFSSFFTVSKCFQHVLFSSMRCPMLSKLVQCSPHEAAKTNDIEQTEQAGTANAEAFAFIASLDWDDLKCLDCLSFFWK